MSLSTLVAYATACLFFNEAARAHSTYTDRSSSPAKRGGTCKRHSAAQVNYRTSKCHSSCEALVAHRFVTSHHFYVIIWIFPPIGQEKAEGKGICGNLSARKCVLLAPRKPISLDVNSNVVQETETVSVQESFNLLQFGRKCGKGAIIVISSPKERFFWVLVHPLMLLYEGCNHGLMLWAVLVFDVVGCVGMELFEEETNVCNRLQEGGKRLPAKKLEYVPKVGGCSLFLVEGFPTCVIAYMKDVSAYQVKNWNMYQKLVAAPSCVIAYMKAVSAYQVKNWNMYQKLVAAPSCVIAYMKAVSAYQVKNWNMYQKLVAAPSCVIAYMKAVSAYQVKNWNMYQKLVAAPSCVIAYMKAVSAYQKGSQVGWLFLEPSVYAEFISELVFWQVRAWMETSDIVHMNSLLRARHQRRIGETPFKWFLDIVNPIELNMKLFKQLVRRWVPQHHSFRVRHQLVPFDVVDVVMTLGLGVGGLVVPFDESIVGKVGQLFNSSETKKEDMINMFDNIVLNDDIDIDVIADSISISGSAVVLQLWAYERLDLHYHSSGKVHFEWYLRSIDRENPIVRAAFDMDGEGKIDGAPEKGDENVECARAARLEKFRTNIQKIRSLKDEICDYGPKSGVVVDGEGNVEGADATPVEEAPSEGIQEADADAVQDVVHQATGDAVLEEACVEEALGHETTADEHGAHQAACEAVVEEIGAVAATVEGAPVCETAADEDGAHQAACEAVVEEIGAVAATVEGAPVCEIAGDEDGAHQAACEAVVDEIGVDAAAVEGAPVHETVAVENGAHEAAFEAVVDEIGADAALVEFAPVYETTAAADEQPFPEEAVDEEYLGDEVPERDPPAFVDIGEPLTTDFGDVRARVDLDKLYQLIMRKDIVTSYVCEITGQLLSTKDCSSLGPREDVDNMVIMFAATMLMYSEKKSTGVIKRMIFNPMFASQLIYDNKRRIANRHVWQLVDYRPFFQADLVILEDLVTADWVFIPVVTKDHWWCYALKVCNMQFFVIDSLQKGISGRAGIDRSMAKNIQRFWGLLTNTIEDSKICLNVQQAKIPVQPNTYDCGVIMMKVLEIWDGEDKYDGKMGGADDNSPKVCKQAHELVTGDGLGHSEWVELMTTPLKLVTGDGLGHSEWVQLMTTPLKLVTGDGLGHSEWVKLMTTPLNKSSTLLTVILVAAHRLVTGDGLGHSEWVQLMTTPLKLVTGDGLGHSEWVELMTTPLKLVTGDGLGHSEWVELMTTPLKLVTGDGLGHSEWVELMTTPLKLVTCDGLGHSEWVELMTTPLKLVTGDGLGHSEWVELMTTPLKLVTSDGLGHSEWVELMTTPLKLVTADGLGHSEWVELMTTPLKLVTGDGLGHSEWVELMTTPLKLVTGDGLGHSEWVELMTTPLELVNSCPLSPLVTGDGLGHSEWVELMTTPLKLITGEGLGHSEWVELMATPLKLVTGDGLGHSEWVELMTTPLKFVKKPMSDEMKDTVVL
ncbi:hypothetical protein V8G54_027859 [Vigna mungo]|uniref:Ubiquitin-like protease family profile domain-containing protein n=1 Tax=Vigna mungo TaxID=3915 RepID=A0AAQ3MRL6_VIGMU